MRPEEMTVTAKEAKNYLQRYKAITFDIKRLQSELNEVRTAQEGLQAIQYSDMPKARGGSGDLSNFIARYERMFDSIQSKQKAKVAALEEVRQVVESVPDERQRLLLSLRYISFTRWEDIAEQMGYDVRWIYRLHGNALQSAALILANKKAIQSQY